MKGLWLRRSGRFAGGLIGTSVVVPGAAAILVTLLYVYRDSRADSVWISGIEAYALGTAAAVGFWVVLAFVLRRRLTSVETANTSVYGELCEHYDRLSSRVTSVKGESSGERDPTTLSARAEADAQLAHCKTALGLDRDAEPDDPAPRGMDWVLATGYAAVWRRLHRADEAMFLVEPICDVVGTALLDEARLEGSAIAGRDQLLRQVRTAIGVLDPTAQQYLGQKEEAKRGEHGTAGAGATNAELTPGTCQARIVLRNVSRVINEYRDDRRDGLIRARNNLYRTVFVTGMGAYILLGIALVREVDESAVVAMASFYLVGGILGLFRQLGRASSIDTVREGDYGLATARLLHTPLFSGLAAVGGVVLVALLGAIIPSGDQPSTPQERGGAIAAESRPAIPTLGEIFDLGKNQFGLVAAAVFGLTPNLLIQRLEKQAEHYKDDLKSTEASGTSSASSSTS